LFFLHFLPSTNDKTEGKNHRTQEINPVLFLFVVILSIVYKTRDVIKRHRVAAHRQFLTTQQRILDG
jgi:hypothetical protein